MSSYICMGEVSPEVDHLFYSQGLAKLLFFSPHFTYRDFTCRRICYIVDPGKRLNCLSIHVLGSTMQASEEATGVGKVTLSQVQLKLVGGDLSVLQEFSADLTLQCTCVGKTCKVGFYRDGDHFVT